MKTIKKLFVLALALLVCTSLTACGSSDDTSSDSDGSTSTWATTVNYAIGGEPDALDPATGADSVTAFISNQLYMPLFNFAEDGSLINEFCTSYEVSDDGLVYTLHFLEGALWSDGVEITAYDVEYAIKRSLGMGVADAYYSYFIADYVLNAAEHSVNMSDVADMDDLGVAVIDNYTLEITLEAPCDYFVGLLTAGVFTPIRSDVAPEHDYLWANTVGYPTSGGFTLESFDSTTSYQMVKNENFYYADDVVIENLVAYVITDQSAQLVAFQTGEIDIATSLSSDVTKIYADQPELTITPSVINYYMRINSQTSDVEALSDVNVRRALQLGIDRSNIILALDAGDVYYELYGDVPKGMEGVDGDFREEQDATDPLVYTDKDEARALMEAAGYSADNPLQIVYYYNQTTMHDTVAQVIQAEFAEIYVELTLQTGEIRTFFDDLDYGFYELGRSAMSADYMDPTTFLDQAVPANQATWTWGDETYADMLSYANSLTGDERMEALHDAEEYLVRDMAYMIPLFGYNQVFLVKAGTEDFESSPQGNATFWYVKVPN